MASFSIHSVANVVVFYLAACIVAINSEESEIGKLPYCGPEKTITQKLVFVSTLDGRLTALDAADGGALSWSIQTGPGPMLSSSIHRLELTNNGQWVRMIPSLSGGIYKFNGSSIEPLPVSADILLKSAPFTFSSDLAMSGGKETRTYGVNAQTGQVVYECSMDGCTNSTENFAADDVVVVQRQTQTVRAIEARTGIERWNFSVGQHDLNFISDTYSDCHDEKTPDDYELKVIVPEGLICSVSRKTGEIVWKHKFEAPVVAAWQLLQGEMFPVDLFSGAQWSPSYNDELGPMTPTLYIGMHNRQLYIQESVTLHERVDKLSTALMTTSIPSVPQIPWAPVPATALAFIGTGEEISDSTELGSTELTTIARSFLYASEYVNGNGYYLFSSPNLKCQPADKGNDTIDDDRDHDHDQNAENQHGTSSTSFNYRLVLSLSYFTHWWVEIIIIITSTVVLVNLLRSERFMAFMNRFPFAQRFMRYMNLLPYTNKEVLQQHVLGVESPVFMLRDHEHILPHRSNSEPFQHVSNEFSSRYLNDFDPVHCLGKGGFGVVFEAKNKIDDCHYAVKRIPLPNRQESRDRVMREVKALAKLDHQNIVRYFNAWLECPPPGWQEEQDKLVPNCDAFSSMVEPTSIDYSSQAGNVTLSKLSTPQKCNSVYLNLGSESESESFSKCQQLPRYNPDKSDSFIVFEDSGGKESELNVDDCGDDDDDGEDDDETVDDDSGADMTEDNTKSKSCINKNNEKCVLSWASRVTRKRTSSTTECHSAKKKLGHRRPKSLDISSGGGIILPKVSRVYLFIQMQLCRRESLREWLRDNVSNRNTSEVLRIFEQIVQAVEYVHLQGLIHRDLKPSNIFFSLNGEIKVGDFGLVTAMVENSAGQRTPSHDPNNVLNTDETHTARVGTQLYMSPEQALGLPYNYKVDIYSLGVILFELLVPFQTAMERSCVLMDLRNNKFPQYFQEEFEQEYELLQLMLSHSPEKRPTTYGIRARPPLNKYTNLSNTEEQWHFELPALKRELSKTSSVSTNSSSESWEAV